MQFTQRKAKVIQTHTAMNRKVGAVITTAKAECTVSPLKEWGGDGRERGKKGGKRVETTFKKPEIHG